MRNSSLRMPAFARGFLRQLGVLKKTIIRPLLMIITLIVGIGLTFYLVASASHVPPPSPGTNKNEDPSLSRVATDAKTLRNAAGNPDGFMLQQVLGMRDGSFCYLYWVQNKPFSGIILEHAVLPKKAGNLDRSDAAWHHRCAKKTGADLTENINRLLAD